MAFPIHLRATRSGSWLGAWLLCCFVLTHSARATWAQTPATLGPAVQDQAQQGAAGQGPAQQPPTGQDQPEPGQAAQPVEGAGAGTAVAAIGLHPVQTAPGKRNLREAEDAYLAGAKKLQQNDLNGAEREFTRALKL